jgi:DNA primase
VIPRATIDQIMSVAMIEEVIGDFVQLKKSGSSYKGLSPFTNEKTPSFYVSPSKGIFKCFSSGKGGNSVTFLMEHEKLSYPEALRWLADK